ncbi:MAG: methyl-accepting chemotaxis protein, partial [bacterium]|nr:methyl-accepting chemotaxis protein [bacterium]
MVLVRQSRRGMLQQIRTVQIALAIAGAVAFLLTIVTTRVLLGRYLGRPLKRLLKGADAIGAGKLDQTIELPEHTELRVLADTLNASAAKLAGMIRRIRRQRDDFRTLYGLVDQLSRSVLPEERRRRAVELASKILNTDCLLIRTGIPGQTPGSDGVILFPHGDTVVERPFSSEDMGGSVPPFY